MTLNLDATGHQWVRALVQFNFKLDYEKGHDNTMAHLLSRVATQLDPNMVRSILDGVALGTAHQAEVHNPTIVESDCHLKQEVCVTAGCALVQMHVTDWAESQERTLHLMQYWTGERPRREQI